MTTLRRTARPGRSFFPFVLLAACGCSRPAAPTQPPPEEPGRGPVVRVKATYPGASAKVVADAIALPIEQQVNGAEGVERLESESRDDGTYALTVRLAPKADPRAALAAVQNRVALAAPQLPGEVRRQGVTVDQKDFDQFPSIWIALTSPDGTYDALYLGRYAALRVQDEVVRSAGAADVRAAGADAASVRVWLDPDKLAARKVTTEDVVAALRRQNARVEVGRPPNAPDRNVLLTATTLGRLAAPEGVRGVIVRSSEGGQVVYLGDVGRVELAAGGGTGFARVNGKPAAVLAVYSTPGSPAAEGVRKVLARLAKDAPKGLHMGVIGDRAADRFAVVEVRLPEPATPERAAAVAGRVGKALEGITGVADTFVSSSEAADAVTLVAKLAARNPASAADIRKRLAESRDAAVRVSDLSAGRAFPVRVALVGDPDGGDEALRRWADAVTARLARDGDAADPATDPGPPAARWQIDLDRDKLEKSGVRAADVVGAIGAALGTASVSDFDTFDRTSRLSIRPERNVAAEDVLKLEVRGCDGDRVKLGTILAVKSVTVPPAVFRVDLRPAVRITAALPEGKGVADVASKCVEVAEAVRKELKLPESLRVVNLTEAKSR